MRPTPKSALIIVDVQNDFIPGGALPVPEGDRVVPILNEYIGKFVKGGGKIFATRDWHPPNHISFKDRGGPWPPHCVQGTWGASFHKDLRLPADAIIISKASSPDKEAYSGFQDTELAGKLRQLGIRRVFIGGLATDYCVLNTVMDALSNGFETYLLLDGCRGIDLHPGDVERAVGRMVLAGAKPVTLKDIT